ncbi:hypothetical protein LWI29_014689 [Acer saccharum]|uniref:Uncharacterized protein n=1 Tax=Acer saccharum TaxID=4024 RepID=A0AA39VVN0_ACESA|nr:hypothetical protein LWI29_014689 [Acer saccharum]
MDLMCIAGASYTINAEDGMTYITGRADPSKLLRKLKSSKYADICWVKTGNHTMYGANTGQGMMMEQQPPPAAYNWHNHYPPPPPHHHRHHTLPYYQQQRPSIAYPYNDYPQYGYCSSIARRPESNCSSRKQKRGCENQVTSVEPGELPEVASRATSTECGRQVATSTKFGWRAGVDNGEVSIDGGLWRMET